MRKRPQAVELPPTRESVGRTRWREWVLVAAALCAVAWFYGFTIGTTGDVREDATFDYYNPLVDGLRSGHLYLTTPVDPRLLAETDPYNPDRNRDIRLPDASYYRGHYYLYFGVTPAAALMLPYTIVTGRHLPEATAVLVFCLLGLAAGSALWLAFRRRYFPDSAGWIGAAGILVLGFGTHLLALARRPEVWELPIAASFAFIMLALFAAYWALHGKRPVLALGTAGLCLGLAVGARPTAVLMAGFLPIAILGLRAQRRDVTWVRAGAAAALTLGAVLLALGWYNFARFGSPFQFGEAYQLTSLREGSVEHFAARFFLHNLRVYFFWPVRWTLEWPFLGARPLPDAPAGYYGGEDVYWLAVLAPLLWLAPLSALVYWRRIGVPSAGRTIVAAIAAAWLPVFVLILAFFSATERYMVEFLPTMTLLGLIGLLACERAVSGAARHVVRTLAAVAVVVTVFAGVLASFDYHDRVMQGTAPATWNRLSRTTEYWVDRALAVIGRGPCGHADQFTFTPPSAAGREIFLEFGRGNTRETLWIERGGDAQGIRLGYTRGNADPRWSTWIHRATGDSIALRVQLPAMNRVAAVPPDAAPPLAWQRGAMVRVKADGREVLACLATPLSGAPILRGSTPTAFTGHVSEQQTVIGWAAAAVCGGRPGWTLWTAGAGSPAKWAAPADPAPAVGPGGTLRVRAWFADVPPGTGEPLVVTGRRGLASIIGVRRAKDGRWRFFHDRWASPLQEGKPVRLTPDRWHDLEITFPSFREDAFGVPARGEIVVRVDGQTVFRAASATDGFYPNQVALGVNRILATTCNRAFTGWLVAPRWVKPGR